jgi:hypothetical protein
MKIRAFALLIITLALAGLSSLRAQSPKEELKDILTQGKAAWATNGDREGAATKVLQVINALEPSAKTLDAGWQQVLCEAYSWMATLDDRVVATRPRATKWLESLLDLSPDFELDKQMTSSRLQASFDSVRGAKLCKVTLKVDPAGGVLSLDGKPLAASTASNRYFLPGNHTLAYAKPGYQTLEQQLTLATGAKDAKAIEMKLERTSSAITVFTSPIGAEIWLDGKRQGISKGMAPPEAREIAETAGLRLDQMSAGFTLADMGRGVHVLEVKMPCHRPMRLNIKEDLTFPFRDLDLNAVKLEPSRATLTVLSSTPGGELFLSGKSFGPVPVKDLSICAEPYDLQIRYKEGSFTQKINPEEGKGLTITARPKPRLIYIGFEGSDDFAGRDRILGMLNGLGERLGQVAWATAAKGEKPQECLTRIQAAKDTELLLRARPIPGKPIHQIELVLSTLTGQEERMIVKPLENDPLATLVARMERSLNLSEPWAGITLVDYPGSGPLVLQADAAALKAGIKPLKPLLQANGKAVASVLDFKRALREAQGGKLSVSQGEAPVTLTVTQQALELPVSAADLSYPFVLSDLRLRYNAAAGSEEAALLRLHQALALMHFREFDKALEVLRDARTSSIQGVCQGTLDFYTGVCLLRMGNVYLSESQQSFNQALKYPQATLFGPEGPLLAPLARQQLEDLKP